MIQKAELAPKLQRAVAQLLGPPGDIGDLRRLTAGATKTTWMFDAQTGAKTEALVLQLSNSPAAATDKDPPRLPRVSARDDAALLVAAARADVPSPPLRAVLTPDFELGDGYIMDYVPGETIPRRILREPCFAPLRSSFAAQCGEILARIHAMDPASLPFLAPFDAGRQIALYRDVYDSIGYPVPALEVGFRWASDHVPNANRTMVVHGDFRMGNLICGDDCIRAVLDWELACLGDPIQDLGWLCVRTWRFGGSGPVGGVGQRAELLSAYERAAAVAVHPAHLRFWEGWGSIKWAVMCLIKGRAYRADPAERTVEAFAIGRRMEEPIHDFLEFLTGKD